MKRTAFPTLLLFLLSAIALTTSGCEVVGGLMKGSFYVGIIIAVVVIGGLLFLFRRRS